MKKEFFWRDKSGRGFTNTFSSVELIGAFETDEVDDNDRTIPEWLDEDPEVGARWENNANEITRIK